MSSHDRTQSSRLINEKCTACRADSPAVGNEELNSLLPLIANWEFIEENGTITVKGIKNKLVFTQKIIHKNKKPVKI